ncbi:Hint domain-containing protein [Halomonas binhaiensis]|uniref:Hint domain-containing protein n=1 Tax=Halomonas binhaiensis TaxID=2562282 RepID=A0A5C1NIW1_9GAMM|nr:Hint domain-containing protein [Halomonas binhaiensis]QEM81689.1 Hint domain-containing protein [Halomonas binhaiensis]
MANETNNGQALGKPPHAGVPGKPPHAGVPGKPPHAGNPHDDKPPVCFAAGSMIATPEGEVAVETLAIGDLVMTASGEQVAVKWVGHQTFRPVASSDENLQPVRISAGALETGKPNRDLVLTASHGVIIDGLVINAGALVNQGSIDFVAWNELPDTVTYYHIETENHEVILANGTEAETYIDYIERKAFDNYDEYVALYGTETRIVEMPHHRISARRLVPLALRQRLGIELNEAPMAKTA